MWSLFTPGWPPVSHASSSQPHSGHSWRTCCTPDTGTHCRKCFWLLRHIRFHPNESEYHWTKDGFVSNHMFREFERGNCFNCRPEVTIFEYTCTRYYCSLKNNLKCSILGGTLKGLLLTNIQRDCTLSYYINSHVINVSELHGTRPSEEVLYWICSIVLHNKALVYIAVTNNR